MKDWGAQGDRENMKMTKKVEMPPFRDQLEEETRHREREREE